MTVPQKRSPGGSAFPWGKVDFLRFTAEKTDEGLFNTTPFLLEKETGLCLKEKVHPCCRSRVNCPLFRGQNAPPGERRFPIPTVAARGRQRFSILFFARLYCFHISRQGTVLTVPQKGFPEGWLPCAKGAGIFRRKMTEGL